MDFQPQPHQSIVNIDSHLSTTNSSHISGDDDSERPNPYAQDVFSDLGAAAESLFSDSDHIQHRFHSAPPPKLLPIFVPPDRTLPPREVSEETIDDAYVDFILYCNPQVSLNADTEELRRIFRQLPKSDGKTFNIIHLLDLIRKLEEKEIKTWTKLAVDLGVERTEEQSAQKVQQYAVRLKRWMHAMHIDAFFAYCLGKPHTYYTQIPLPNSPSSVWEDRDGVPLEEDLALRALHPESRPKRGRRKTEDKDPSEIDLNTAKRHHMEEQLHEQFINHNPMFDTHSTLGDGSESDSIGAFMDGQIHSDPWSSVNVGSDHGGSNNHQFRQWRPFQTDGHDALCSPGGMSHTSTSHDDQIPLTSISIPTSASAAKPRPRRRHGPAVSSAWPSSSNSLTGKMRGRPPSNRSTRDGPFSSFPVNPPVRSNSTPVDSLHSSLMQQPMIPGQFVFSPISATSSPMQLLPDRPHSAINIQTPQMSRSITDQGGGLPEPGANKEDLLSQLESLLLDKILNPGFFDVPVSTETATLLARRVTEEVRKVEQTSFGEQKGQYLNTITTLLGQQTQLRITKVQRDTNGDDNEFQSLAGIDLHDHNVQHWKGTYNLKWTVNIPPFNGEMSMDVYIDELEKHGEISRMVEDNHTMTFDGMGDDGGLMDATSAVDLATQRKIADLERQLKEKDELILSMRRILMDAIHVSEGVHPV